MNMGKRLTKEQYEKLQPFETNIKNAVKNSFVHMSGNDFNTVADIYAEIFGVQLTKSQRGCNTCRLNTLKKLGELYNEYTQKSDEKEKKVVKTRAKKIEEKANDE